MVSVCITYFIKLKCRLLAASRTCGERVHANLPLIFALRRLCRFNINAPRFVLCIFETSPLSQLLAEHKARISAHILTHIYTYLLFRSYEFNLTKLRVEMRGLSLDACEAHKYFALSLNNTHRPHSGCVSLLGRQVDGSGGGQPYVVVAVTKVLPNEVCKLRTTVTHGPSIIVCFIFSLFSRGIPTKQLQALQQLWVHHA